MVFGREKLTPERKGIRQRTFGALSALYILAAGMPGITVPAHAQDDIGDSISSDIKVDPAAKEKRKQGQEIVRKALGSEPGQIEKKMHELLALGPQCKEKVDRSKLAEKQGAEEMYQKLSRVFAKYNSYMGSLNGTFRGLREPVRPKAPVGTNDFEGEYYDSGSDFFTFEPDPSASPEEIQKVIEGIRGMGKEIEDDIKEIMEFPDADELVKLLLEESNCHVS